MLADREVDGVGDVNEEIAGTDPGDPDSTPGQSGIDVIAFFNAGFASGVRDPLATIHHALTVADATGGTTAHEIDHLPGLGHFYRQSRVGTFRWSRGDDLRDGQPPPENVGAIKPEDGPRRKSPTPCT